MLQPYHSIRIISPKSTCSAEGIVFSFPKLLEPVSSDFKDDSVRHQKRLGKRVVYVGDGAADYRAASLADLRLAIKSSNLARLCKRDDIPLTEVSNFAQVIREIEDWRSKLGTRSP